MVALLLSLLLVGMQAEAHRHALSHCAPLDATQQPAWHAPGDTSCAECALLAAGSAGLVDRGTEHRAPPVALWQPDAAFVAPASAPPSFYRSRAPPSPS
jgi:hypothetical protein